MWSQALDPKFHERLNLEPPPSEGASVDVVEVTAHRNLSDSTQAPSFTENNARADRLAFKPKVHETQPYISRARDIQTHLVATLQLRKHFFQVVIILTATVNHG